MNQSAFDFSIVNSYPFAKAHFLRMCGLDLSIPAHQSHFQEAGKVHKELISDPPLHALISELPAEKFENDQIIIEGVSLSCKAFEQIDHDSVSKIAFYVVTAGEAIVKTESLTELFYADLWLTAYIEAGREIIENGIRKSIAENTEQILSPSFGPGYYGMGINQVSSFLKILSAERIGVKLSSNGSMFPLKTCVGMFLILEKDSNLPQKSCESCLGGEQGCYYCKGVEGK